MAENYERVEKLKYVISQKEMDRRFNAVQSAIKAKGLDAIVIQTHSFIFDMYIRYLTDRRCHAYSTMLLVPAEGEMYFIDPGFAMNPNAPVPADLKRNHVGKFAMVNVAMCFNYSDIYPCKYMVDEIKYRGYNKIGIAGMSLMGYYAGKYLTENLPNAEFVDFTDDIDEIIAVKSEEEQLFLKKTVDIHCEINEAIPSLISVGRTLKEIHGDIFKIGRDLNCEVMPNIFVNAGPNGKFETPGPIGNGNIHIQRGDAVSILLELAAEGGMYAEVGRTFLLFDPTEEQMQNFRDLNAGELYMIENIKPGMTCAEVVDMHDAYFEPRGFGVCTRIAGHGQGYGLMERPAFNRDDKMVLKEGMFYCLHPGGNGPRKSFFFCNNYIIRKDRSELITWSPMEPKILDR